MPASWFELAAEPPAPSISALIAAFTPVAGRAYAVMLLFVGGTPPALIRSSSTSANTPNVGQTSISPRKYFTAGTGQSSMPTSFTMSGTTATGAVTYWVGLK